MKLNKTNTKKRHVQTLRVKKKKNVSLKNNPTKKSRKRESNKLKVRVSSKKKRQLIGGASVSLAASDYFETGTYKYNDEDKDVIMIPIDKLKSTRRRKIGVENAKSLMSKVKEDGFEKRSPLYVKYISDSDQYEVLDGNSSYHASKDKGLTELPVVIFNDEESQQIVSKNKEKALGKLKLSFNKSPEKILGALETIEEVFKEELEQNDHLKELIVQTRDTVSKQDKETKINELHKKLTDVFYQKKAQDLHAKAEEMEPEVTKDLQSIIDEIGAGQLEGTKFKFKSLDRIKDKLKRKAGDHKPLRDILRYTIVLPTNSYFCEASKVIAMLHNKEGYTTEEEWLKSAWSQGDAYKGINTSWRKTKNGEEQLFELQIHTPESLNHKEGMHDLYQECQEGTEESCNFLKNNMGLVADDFVPSPSLTPAGEMTGFSFPLPNQQIEVHNTCPLVGNNTNTNPSGSIFLLLFLFLINVLKHKRNHFRGRGGGIDLKSVEKLKEHFIKIDTSQGREKAIKELQHVFNNPEYGQKLL